MKLLFVTVLALFAVLQVSGQGDGFTCMQWRHSKDTEAYAQTCAVAYPPKSLPYWTLMCTWQVYSDCRACGSPFKDCNAAGTHVWNNITYEYDEVTIEKIDKPPVLEQPPVEQHIGEPAFPEPQTLSEEPATEVEAVATVVEAALEDPGSDPTDLCKCCLYGEAPYYDTGQFIASELNPATGQDCDSTLYQFKLMGDWFTADFDAAYSWCFWQTYYVTPNASTADEQ